MLPHGEEEFGRRGVHPRPLARSLLGRGERPVGAIAEGRSKDGRALERGTTDSVGTQS
jgi:hypothetical protein